MNETVRRLAQFIRQNPGDLFSRFALALEMVKLGEDEKARTLFESIQQIQPDYPGLPYHLGKFYQRIGELEMAESLFQKGIEFTTEKGDLHAKNELLQAMEELKFVKSEMS